MKTRPCEAFELRGPAVVACRVLTDSGMTLGQPQNDNSIVWHRFWLCRKHLLTWALLARRNAPEVSA